MASSSDEPTKYFIKINDLASQELDEIYNYIKEDVGEDIAYKQESLIIRRIRQLSVFPNGYPMLESKPPLRSVRAGRYRIFFLVNDDKKTVEVVHIFHSRRDIDSLAA